MSRYQQKTNSDAETRALEKFTEMMIERIREIQSDWKKPWFSESASQWPKNMSGREYNGMNALCLMLHAEKLGYKIPVWATFDRITGLNYKANLENKKVRITDNNGHELPMVTINKGEKSCPVFINTFTCVHSETKERIKYDDYKQLTEEERATYNIYPKLQVYNVFAIEQTNMAEARPELYAKYSSTIDQVKKPLTNEFFSFAPLDLMINNNLWVCPIKEVDGDEAYYSISRDEIVVPKRSSFIDGESFVSNTFHECTHSLGAEGRLNRLKPSSFGSAEYAKEELVAELTAAAVSSRYGISKHVKSDSAAYLKSWLNSLNESPEFIRTVLMDVKRSASLMTQRIDRIQQAIDEGVSLTKEDFAAEQRNTFLFSQNFADSKTAKNVIQESNDAKQQNTNELTEKDVQKQEEPIHFRRGR